MKSRLGRKVAAGLALVGACAMAPGTAWADGTQTPPNAPRITVGTPVFGNTKDPAASPYQDYYRLPNLLAQDVVTVAALPDAYKYFCLAGDVDQYNWQQSGCNLSDYEYVQSTGERFKLQAARATNAAHLRIYNGSPGPYQFTVEKIQHRLALSISAGAQVSRTGQVTVRTHLTNGAGAANGHPLALTVVVGGRSYVYRATTSGGRAVFDLNLPPETEGKTVSLKASSSSLSANYTGATASRSIRVVK